MRSFSTFFCLDFSWLKLSLLFYVFSWMFLFSLFSLWKIAKNCHCLFSSLSLRPTWQWNFWRIKKLWRKEKWNITKKTMTSKCPNIQLLCFLSSQRFFSLTFCILLKFFKEFLLYYIFSIFSRDKCKRQKSMMRRLSNLNHFLFLCLFVFVCLRLPFHCVLLWITASKRQPIVFFERDFLLDEIAV